MRWLLRTFLIGGLLFHLGVPAMAQEVRLDDFGLIQGTLWYSNSTFFDDDRVRIYSGVFNGTDETIRGRALFYDNNTVIGEQAFVALPASGFTQVFTDWVATPGEHLITVQIVEPRIIDADGVEQAVVVPAVDLGEDARFVDIDTDNDRIGNIDDLDDDNDGLPDTEELLSGTDPLSADTDNDGLSDKEEIALGTDPKNSDTDNDGVIDGSDSAPRTSGTTGGSTSALSGEDGSRVGSFVTSVKNRTSEALGEDNVIVPAVSNVTESFIDSVHHFAETHEEGLRDTLKATQTEIALSKEASRDPSIELEESTLRQAWRYIYVALLWLFILIFSYEIILHLLIAHVLFTIITWLVRKWRRRRRRAQYLK